MALTYHWASIQFNHNMTHKKETSYQFVLPGICSESFPLPMCKGENNSLWKFALAAGNCHSKPLGEHLHNSVLTVTVFPPTTPGWAVPILGTQHVQHGHCEPSQNFGCRLGMTHGVTVIWWEAETAYQRETPAKEVSLKLEKIKANGFGLSYYHSPPSFQGRRQLSIHNASKEAKKPGWWELP